MSKNKIRMSLEECLAPSAECPLGVILYVRVLEQQFDTLFALAEEAVDFNSRIESRAELVDFLAEQKRLYTEGGGI